MQFDELRTLITASRNSDWHRIRSGPTYRDSFATWSSPADGSAGCEVHGHTYVAVYKPDIDITIAFGRESGLMSRDLKFGWAEFPDPKVSMHDADVFWRGSLVDRVNFVYVDGGRCALPLGLGHQGLEITRHEFAVARLIDALESGDRFDTYASGVPYEFVD